MTRSVSTGHKRLHVAGRPGGYRHHLLRQLPLASAISAILAGAPAVHAAAEAETNTLEEVVVTAQKRTENLQNVPISIEVLSGAQLEQLDVTGLDGYVKYSPSISYSRGQGQGGNGQPGSSHIYMRGVVSGANENHSGSQPSVGTYLDEQPVTTIDGTPDVHLYDIQRIEVLEGPQGTLYGASSQAGTVRIITNKPDPTHFSASYDVQGNKVNNGGTGYEVEAYANIPLTSVAAIRLVGYYQKDGGYISNIAGTNKSACIENGVRTFPTWAGVPSSFPAVTPCPAPTTIGAGSISNAAYRAKNYNGVETKGGRAALKVDITDNWSVTPTVMAQSLKANGFFGYDPAVGDLKLVHFGPETSDDTFSQAALTVEGKISNFDITYAGAFMKRDTHSIADYSDYSEFYDRVFGSGAYWVDHAGKPIMPQELVVSVGYFQKWSHELRLSTPQDLPVRATIGVFAERQQHRIWEQYVMPGFGFTNPYGTLNSPTPNPDGFDQSLSIPTLANSIWLTDETRIDHDKAVFAQATWDITSHFSVNGGLRYFTYDNTLGGFYGYSKNYPFSSGEKLCKGRPPTTPFAPCTDLDKRVTGSGNVPRANITYKFDPDKLVYATFSKGFRPGGVNRTEKAGIGPYQADFLKNYEIGWKTQWFDHRLRWNGAVFWEDWKNFQFSFLGPNSVTIIENGGSARIKGVENEIEWAATSALTLSTSFTFLDARLTQNYCGSVGVTSCANQVNPEVFGPPLIGPLAPAGTNLPITPKFKGNVIARYSFNEVAGWKPFGQASWVYQSRSTPTLKVDQAATLGIQPAYGLLDLIGGAQLNQTTISLIVTNVADRRAQLSRFAQTNPDHENQPYVIPAQPRTYAIQFGQKF
ncbi:MAG TPA: TonB-dependent receptor [Steroidobacteraceae bacterium]|jgi:outer membrane receptor protein involved in Fe transport|nr:TonB-dependent receptor [Steroidobacteraceae bacterium]